MPHNGDYPDVLVMPGVPTGPAGGHELRGPRDRDNFRDFRGRRAAVAGSIAAARDARGCRASRGLLRTAGGPRVGWNVTARAVAGRARSHRSGRSGQKVQPIRWLPIMDDLRGARRCRSGSCSRSYSAFGVLPTGKAAHQRLPSATPAVPFTSGRQDHARRGSAALDSWWTARGLDSFAVAADLVPDGRHTQPKRPDRTV
jgi:hypothetical protein